MSNNKKLIEIFVSTLGIKESLIIDSLEYNTIAQWDSVAHMTLIAGLEKEFGIMFNTGDIINMSSVAKVKQILAKHGVDFLD